MPHFFSSILGFIKRRWLWLLALVALALGAAGWQQGWFVSKPTVTYKTAKLDRGAVVASVSASGTITPVSSVSVGSQVSGQLKEVLADFNTEVRANQIIAKIDPEIFEYRVRQAQADVDAARAQLLVQQSTLSARRADVSRAEVNLIESRSDAARKQLLFDKQFISGADRDKSASLVRTQDEDLKTAKAQLEVAAAQIKSAESTVQQRQAGLDSARADLAKTVIRSPVDGIVIKRSIEVGQTVAASLSAPELFVIAKNLRDMQVETAIDESDIGKVRQGMKASFTVDSFPGRSFSGEVTQVRKAAQTVQNVVTYTVVVGFSNLANPPEGAESAGSPARSTTTRATSMASPAAASATISAAAPAKTAGTTDAAKPSPASPAATAPAAGAGQGGQGGQGAGGGQRAARERMEQVLGFSDTQKQQVDAIYAGMRDAFMALRDLPEDERPKAIEANRKAVQGKIAAILTPEQAPKFKALIAEQDAARKAAGSATGVSAGTTAAAQRPNSAQNAAQNPPAKTTGPARSPAANGQGAAVSNPAAATLLLPGMTANVRLITAERADVLRVPAAALRYKPPVDKDAKDDKPAGATGAAGAGPAAGAQAGGGGGQGGGGAAIRAYRDRLGKELALTDAQNKQIDEIYSASRERFAALRDMAEADRPKASAAIRADVRDKTAAILTPEQKPKFDAINAEIAAARSGGGSGGATIAVRGRIYVLDEAGKPKAIDVRTGVSDGALAEILNPSEALKEGLEIITGASSTGGAKPSGGSGPRAPF